MKKIQLFVFFVSLVWNCSASMQKDSTGMPGDNFDLEGALYLFKQANSLEGFEKQLNAESNHVNNLDLDQDGSIDYIRVVDNQSERSHAIQLQIAVSTSEVQDVAAILIESDKDGDAKLQMIGDESLYGEEKILDPLDEKGTNSGGRPDVVSFAPTWIYVNVWSWPCVSFIYAPAYVVWVSPYYYGYYPVWWRPWRPVYYHVHYMRVQHYHGWCNYGAVYYVPHAHGVYRSYYRQSPTIYKRYEAPRNNFARKSSSSPKTGAPMRTKTSVQGEKVGGTNNGTERSINRSPNNRDRQVAQPRDNSSRGTTGTNSNRTVNPGSGSQRTPAKGTSSPRPQQQPQTSPRPQPRQQPVNKPVSPRPQPRPSKGGAGKGGKR